MNKSDSTIYTRYMILDVCETMPRGKEKSSRHTKTPNLTSSSGRYHLNLVVLHHHYMTKASAQCLNTPSPIL